MLPAAGASSLLIYFEPGAHNRLVLNRSTAKRHPAHVPCTAHQRKRMYVQAHWPFTVRSQRLRALLHLPKGCQRLVHTTVQHLHSRQTINCLPTLPAAQLRQAFVPSSLRHTAHGHMVPQKLCNPPAGSAASQTCSPGRRPARSLHAARAEKQGAGSDIAAGSGVTVAPATRRPFKPAAARCAPCAPRLPARPPSGTPRRLDGRMQVTAICRRGMLNKGL